MLDLRNKFEGVLRNRFNHLLVLILALLLTAPFTRESGPVSLPGIFLRLIFAASNILILRIMITKPQRFWAATAIFLAVIAVDLPVESSGAPWAGGFVAVADLAYVIFLAVFLRHLMKHLFNEKKITDDSIKGGICIYLLMGVAWGLVYRALHFWDPAAFLVQGPLAPNLFYFSYVTLTTVGYGDIVPATRFAQTLAFLEAVTGQMFVAIFIARLMGFHIAHVINKKDEAAPS